MTPSTVELRRILRRRSVTVVDGWYAALRTSALALHSPRELRQALLDVFERVVTFLTSQDVSAAHAESIGAAFVSLRVRPNAVGSVLQVLTASLLQDLPDSARELVEPRLPALTAGVAAGLYQAGTRALLDQQEEIREAYARALRRAHSELRIKDAGIKASINAIAMLDMDGRLTYVNPAFLDMWRYDDDPDVLGRHIREFGEWQGDIERTLEYLSEHGGWAGEVVAERSDGSTFDVYASVTLIRDATGDPRQLMLFFVDVSARKRIEAALERRAVHATFLNRVGERVYGLRTSDEVLDTVARLTQETFAYHQVAALTLDRDAGALAGTAVAGTLDQPATEHFHVPLGEGITGWAAQHRRTLVVNDVSVDSRYVQLVPGPTSTRSEMAVPILVEGEVAAVLDIQSADPDAFDESDRVVMETLADQVSIALDNARLYQALQRELAQRKRAEARLQRNVHRLEALRDLDQAILVAKSVEEVAQASLHHLCQIIPCQRASIDVFDFEADQVTVIAALQTVGEGKAMAGTHFPLTQRGLLFEMVGDRESVYVRDIRQLPQSSPLIRTLRSEGLRSFVVAPIFGREELIGIVSLASDRTEGFRPEHQPVVEEVADSLAIAIQQARMLDSIRSQRERLREALARLAEVEEEERRAVVRALHDRVGQNLTALDLNISTVRAQLEDRDLPDLRARLGHALSLVEETNARIRRLMTDLRPPVLDDYGLFAALRWHADRFSAQTGISVAVHGDRQFFRDLPAHIESALFRIAQEALNNIAKHAQAEEASIGLFAQETGLRFVVSDDGVGFDRDEVQRGASSWGLLTMRERAEAIGARFSVEAAPDEGTRIVVEVSS